DLLLAQRFLTVEWNAPLETQGTQRRDPADPESCAEAQIQRIEATGVVGAEAHVGRRCVAVLGVEVPRVAAIREDDAADTNLLHDRELDLDVVEELHVPADG